MATDRRSMIRRMCVVLVALLTLATGQDIRGLGMGRLTLIIGSEQRPFDMYGFGRNPAGLYRSDLPRTAGGDSTEVARASVLELYVPGSYWRRAGEQPYEWAIGDPVPGQAQACYPHYTQDVYFDEWYHETGDFIPYVPFAERPSGVFWRSRGSFALAIRGAWSYATMTEDRVHISTPEMDVASAVPLGPVDVGIELPATLMTDDFYHEREQSAFIGCRLGVVVPVHMLELGAAVSGDCPYAYVDTPPVVKGWTSTGAAGSYALQAIVRPADWLKLGAAGGHRTASTGPAFTSPWASLRAECRPDRLPMLAALDAEWTRMQTRQPTFEVEQMDSIGIGVGLGASVWRLSGGAELHYAQRTYSEDTGAARYPDWITNAGAELDLGAVQIRLGYEHSVRPVVDVPGIGFNTYAGTAGFGVDIASVRADVAWDHSYWPFGKETEEEFHLDLKRGW